MAPTLLVSTMAAGRANTFNSSAESIGTGTFKIYPGATTGAAATGAPITLSNSVAAQFAFIKNSGTIDTASFAITVTWAGIKTTTLKYCPLNTTFSSATLCSDSTAPVLIGAGIADGSVVTVTVTMPSGSFLPISVKPSKSDIPTIGTSVSSTQIRAAKVTNS